MLDCLHRTRMYMFSEAFVFSVKSDSFPDISYTKSMVITMAMSKLTLVFRKWLKYYDTDKMNNAFTIAQYRVATTINFKKSATKIQYWKPMSINAKLNRLIDVGLFEFIMVTCMHKFGCYDILGICCANGSTNYTQQTIYMPDVLGNVVDTVCNVGLCRAVYMKITFSINKHKIINGVLWYLFAILLCIYCWLQIWNLQKIHNSIIIELRRNTICKDWSIKTLSLYVNCYIISHDITYSAINNENFVDLTFKCLDGVFSHAVLGVWCRFTRHDCSCWCLY